MQVTRYQENCISLQKPTHSFYFILFKDSIFSSEKTQFLCMKPSFRNDMLVSQAAFILLSYSIFPFSHQAWFHQHLQLTNQCECPKISLQRRSVSPLCWTPRPWCFCSPEKHSHENTSFYSTVRCTSVNSKSNHNKIDFSFLPSIGLC